MAGYNEIRGLRVKYLSADPAGAEDGQVWYNSTTGNLRVQGIGVGAWSSGSSMTTARSNVGPSSAGTQTASFVAGGATPPYTGVTEEYNGSGWSAGGALNTPRGRLGGAGTLTAGLVFGGLSPSLVGDTEEYNGTSWSEQTNLTTPRRNVTGCGIQTAGLAIAGVAGPGSYSNATEEYDGSSWTNGGNLPATSTQTGTAGIQTAALAFAFGTGGSPYNNNITCSYDGTSWTNISLAMNTTRRAVAGAGSQTAALAMGGLVAPTSAKTELYNGTSWVEQADMSTARYELGGSGTSLAALAFGGTTGSVTAATEEYNFSTSTVTAGAWSAGDNIPTATTSFGGAGTRDATLVFGGYVGGPGVTGYIATTFEYDGASWTGGGALPVARNSPINFGTQTAAVAFAGNNQNPSGGVYLNSGDHYDGSSWTATPNNYPTTISNAGSVGTQTAGLAFAGYTGTALTNATNEYNGTSWTGTGNYPVSISGMGVAGIQTSALSFGGTDNGSPFPASGQTTTAEYNGSSWTALTGLPGGRIYPQGAGTTNADNARSIGGRNTSGSSITETLIHDGTAWATQPSLAAARQNASAGGVCSTSAAATIISGSPLPSSTENFTGETITVNSASNITTS